jgi:alkylhydroperoxidase family enzyme
VARLDIPEGDGPEIKRLWSLAPEVGAGAHAFSEAVYERASLPVREREVARMRIAQLNECHV